MGPYWRSLAAALPPDRTGGTAVLFFWRMEELSRGAESVVFQQEGRVVKVRLSKRYRIPQIDEKLNKSRTKMEKSILARIAPLGIAPQLLPLSRAASELVESLGEQLSSAIEMEQLSGETLTAIWQQIGPVAAMESLVRLAGAAISRLHSMEVVHGDLTLNNLIVQGSPQAPEGANPIKLIDFGLSKISSKAEDKAVDLYLFEKAVKSLTGREYQTAIEEGYQSVPSAGVKSTLAKLEEVRRRGRKRELAAVG